MIELNIQFLKISHIQSDFPNKRQESKNAKQIGMNEKRPLSNG